MQDAGHGRTYINVVDINADVLNDIPLSVPTQDSVPVTVSRSDLPQKGSVIVRRIRCLFLPHAYANMRWGNPSQNAAQLSGCVHEDQRADKLQKVWGFWVGTWNVDSLTGRAGELMEMLTDKELGVACILHCESKKTVPLLFLL